MVMSSGSSFPVLKVEEEVWSDDRTLAFAWGHAASGNVQVGDENVRLAMIPSWLLPNFPKPVQRRSVAVGGSCSKGSEEAGSHLPTGTNRYRWRCPSAANG